MPPYSAACISPIRICCSVSWRCALNTPDRDTFYSPGPKGYIDYPALEATL